MRIHHIASAAVLSVMLTVPATAQEQQGLPFAGCWAPADGLSSRDRLCITPTGTSMLEVTSITADGKVTESQLSLDGTRVAVKSEQCEGWEEGRLTADGERIIVSAEITCGREPKQVRATAFTITPSGHLLQATGTGLAMVASTQVRLYGPVASYADIPSATRELLMPYLISAERSRLGIREHAVSAKDLVEFDDMGLAPELIDVLVASSYPKSFVIDGLGEVASAELVQGNALQRSGAGNPFMFMNGYPMMSNYDWQMLYECQRFGLYCGASSRFGRYGAGFGGYGYGGFGYGGFGGYYPGGYGIPVVVRPVVTPGPTAPGGRAIRGRGYTQSGSSNSGGTASPRSSSGRSGASSRSGGSSGSSGSSAGSSSGGSSARTAKPRP